MRSRTNCGRGTASPAGSCCTTATWPTRSTRTTSFLPARPAINTVRAVDANGAASAWSAYASATVAGSAPTPTSTPASAATATPTPTQCASALSTPLLTAESKAASTVELSGNAVSGAVTYELWAWDSVNGWQQLDDGNLTGTAHTHRELSAGTTYHYTVRAVDANGAASAWSAYAYATAPETSVIPDASEERDALVAFYHATDGPNWTKNHTWLTNEPISTWYGVTTDESGHVTGLHLPGNNLSGSIPDLSALTNLIQLNLNGNRLSGPIQDLRAFTNLIDLNLGINQLSGPIPDLSALTKMTVLDMEYNQLCLPDGASLSHPNSDVDAHLKSLNLPSCTPACPEQLASSVAS